LCSRSSAVRPRSRTSADLITPEGEASCEAAPNLSGRSSDEDSHGEYGSARLALSQSARPDHLDASGRWLHIWPLLALKRYGVRHVEQDQAVRRGSCALHQLAAPRRRGRRVRSPLAGIVHDIPGRRTT
jgi:hypothetical protein